MSETLSIFFSHPNREDYINEVYPALRESPICQGVNLVLPHENSTEPIHSLQVLQNHRPNIILFADITGKRFGVGTEVGMAKALEIPIHALIKTGSDLSSSGKFLADQLHWYSTTADLVKIVEASISTYENK